MLLTPKTTTNRVSAYTYVGKDLHLAWGRTAANRLRKSRLPIPPPHNVVFPTVRQNPPFLHKNGIGTVGIEPTASHHIRGFYHFSYVPMVGLRSPNRASNLFGLSFSPLFVMMAVYFGQLTKKTVTLLDTGQGNICSRPDFGTPGFEPGSCSRCF